MLLHLTFIASAVFLGLIERIHPMGHGKHADDGDGEPRSSDHKN